MLVQLNELVILMTIEKLKDKDEIRNCMGIVLDLVDRSNEVVVGTIEKSYSKKSEEQRGDAKDTKSTRGVPWQRNVSMACAASVQMAGTVKELREDEARWFCVRREVKLAQCGFSKDREGCSVTAWGDEVLRPSRQGVPRERVRMARLCDDAGQQKTRAAEEQLTPVASAARAEVAQEGQASPARVLRLRRRVEIKR